MFVLCREIFFSDISTDELPAHRYQRSIHNIVVERSWLHLRMELGDNAVLFFRKGEEEGIYNPMDEQHQCVSLLLFEFSSFLYILQGTLPMAVVKTTPTRTR